MSIPVDNAWTEIDFVGSTELDREVWRFHMVREGGVWKVCSVEPRPDAPLPPAGVGTVNRLTVRTLASFDSQSPEQVRRILLGEHLASRLRNFSQCSFQDDTPGTGWSLIATGSWPVKQENGGYLSAFIEASPDLSRWRLYTIPGCELRQT